MSDDLLTLTESLLRLWAERIHAHGWQQGRAGVFSPSSVEVEPFLTRLRAQRSTPETLPEISPDDWRWQLWRHTQPGLALREQCGGAEMCCLSEPEYQAALAQLLAATQPVDEVTAAAEAAARERKAARLAAFRSEIARHGWDAFVLDEAQLSAALIEAAERGWRGGLSSPKSVALDIMRRLRSPKQELGEE